MLMNRCNNFPNSSYFTEGSFPVFMKIKYVVEEKEETEKTQETRYRGCIFIQLILGIITILGAECAEMKS